MRTKLTAAVFTAFFMVFAPWKDEVRFSLYGIEKNYSIKYEGNITPGRWLRNIKLEYTWEGSKSAIVMQIFFPKKYKKGDDPRTIIALHGHSDSYRDWANETNIDGYANTYNFVVVCPDMGKTVYETRYYPETKYKWGPIPGGRFVGEVLVPAVRDEFGIAMTRPKTGITGTSGGARGAMIVASVYKEMFSVAAGFAGNYDHLSMTKDRQLVAEYGEYEGFKERWENDDNLMKLADNLFNTNIFLFHGFHDNTVAREQSWVFAMKIGQVKKKFNSNITVRYKERKYMGHDWKSWNRALPEAMEFFDKFLAK